MKEILIRSHLGLGDHLICNALVREYAKNNHVTIFAKPHNVPAVTWMFRDNTNIEVVEVKDDKEADELVGVLKEHGKKVLGIGMFGPGFKVETWDKCFYQQARIDWGLRFKNFKVDQQPSRELPVPSGKYVFVHDDPERGFTIDPALLPRGRGIKIVRPEPGRTDNIFDYWSIIVNAWGLELMESSFAILADSLPFLKAEKKRIHLYTRKSIPPTYNTTWEFVTKDSKGGMKNK